MQTTDVMVNLTHWQVQKSPAGLLYLMRKLLLLRIHFLNVIVHNRSELHWCLDVWNWRVGSAGTFNYDRPIIKDFVLVSLDVCQGFQLYQYGVPPYYVGSTLLLR